MAKKVTKNQVEATQFKEAKLWQQRGVEDVYFQREAQVNFWTLMGGIATAALLTQLTNLVEQLQASQWHLTCYFLSSIFILINAWTQTSWGTLVLRWTINIPTNIMMFLGQFSLAIQCLQVTYPPGWMAASGCLILFTLGHQLYFMRTGSWQIFPIKEYGRSSWVSGYMSSG